MTPVRADLLPYRLLERALQDHQVQVDDLRVTISLLQAVRVARNWEAHLGVGEQRAEDLLSLRRLLRWAWTKIKTGIVLTAKAQQG